MARIECRRTPPCPVVHRTCRSNHESKTILGPLPESPHTEPSTTKTNAETQSSIQQTAVMFRLCCAWSLGLRHLTFLLYNLFADAESPNSKHGNSLKPPSDLIGNHQRLGVNLTTIIAVTILVHLIDKTKLARSGGTSPTVTILVPPLASKPGLVDVLFCSKPIE